jgi:hypothetical protein
MKVEPARRTEQFGGRAWLDYWDSVTVTTTQLFVAEIVARVESSRSRTCVGGVLCDTKFLALQCKAS